MRVACQCVAAHQCGFLVGSAVHYAYRHDSRQMGNGVVEPVAQPLVFGDDRAAGVDGDERIHVLLHGEQVGGRLLQPHHSPDGEPEVFVARGLSAPRSAVDDGPVVDDAHRGVVVVEQLGVGQVPYPQRGMGAFSRSAPPHEQVGASVAEHRRRMDGYAIVEQDGLGESDAHERRKRMAGVFVVGTQVGPNGREIGIRYHAVGIAAVVDLHEVAIRYGEETEVAHVVVGLLDKPCRQVAGHVAGRQCREREQPLPVGRIRYAEGAKGGQQRLGVHPVGQPEREKKVRYAEIIVC